MTERRASPDEYDAVESAYLESRALVAAEAEGDERAVEAALRPRSLAEVIGQERVREQLSLVLQAALGRSSTPDHVLLAGPPGLGKTTLAMIIAADESCMALAAAPTVFIRPGPFVTRTGAIWPVMR